MSASSRQLPHSLTVGAGQRTHPQNDASVVPHSSEHRRKHGCRPRSRSVFPDQRRDTRLDTSDRAADPQRRYGPPCSQRLRRRALTSGASQRGLVPTSSSASAFSMPGDAGVDDIGAHAHESIISRHPAGNPDSVEPRALINCLRATSIPHHTDHRRERQSCLRNALTLAAMAPKASSQLASRSFPSSRDIWTVQTLTHQPVTGIARLVGHPFLVDVLVAAAAARAALRSRR